MRKEKLTEVTEKFKIATKDALQTLFNNVPKGQRKQLVKIEEIKHLFDTYGVEY